RSVGRVNSLRLSGRRLTILIDRASRRRNLMTQTALNELTEEQDRQRERLLAILRDMRRVVVAFSGGIDSTVVAQAAHLALGDAAIAVTADSPSVARAELDDARRLAAHIGIRHRIVRTDEFQNPN